MAFHENNNDNNKNINPVQSQETVAKIGGWPLSKKSNPKIQQRFRTHRIIEITSGTMPIKV
jgi:hypothetical protein